jgi:hypothetical protein
MPMHMLKHKTQKMFSTIKRPKHLHAQSWPIQLSKH